MKKIILVFVLFSLIGGLSLVTLWWLWLDFEQPPPIMVSTTCKLSLKLIQQGTHAKYNLSGSVMVTNANSKFDGHFPEEKGLSGYPITLYFDEQAIHFTITTEDGHIFGDGESEKSKKICSGKVSGKQSGPTSDDQGEWQGTWENGKQTIDPPSLASKLFKWACLGILCILVAFLFGLLIGKQSTKDE